MVAVAEVVVIWSGSRSSSGGGDSGGDSGGSGSSKLLSVRSFTLYFLRCVSTRSYAFDAVPQMMLAVKRETWLDPRTDLPYSKAGDTPHGKQATLLLSDADQKLNDCSHLFLLQHTFGTSVGRY